MRIKLWQLIVGGPFMIWVGIHEFNRLAELEQHGGRIRVDRYTFVLYKLGGKWAVLTIFAAIGAVYLWLLMKTYRAQRPANDNVAKPSSKPVKPARPLPSPPPPRTPVIVPPMRPRGAAAEPSILR